MHTAGMHCRHRLIPIQTEGPKPPLFWIPGGFGSVRMSRLRDLALRLGPDQPMYGLGTTPAQSLLDIEPAAERATAYVSLIREFQPSGPYFLAGFCLGGTLAFEAAQQLRSQGEEVAFLGLLNAWVPISSITAVQWAELLLCRFRHHMRLAAAAGWRRGIPYVFSKVRNIAKLYERGREMRKLPCVEEAGAVTISASPKRLLWGTIRIWGKYVPLHFSGKVYLFISEESDLAGVGERVDPRRGWTRVCSGYEVIQLKGEHVQMLEPPLLDEFAARLARCLREAQADAAARTAPHPLIA